MHRIYELRYLSDKGSTHHVCIHVQLKMKKRTSRHLFHFILELDLPSHWILHCQNLIAYKDNTH